MVRVKICGITNLEDALLAIKCGANALGFVFYKKSPRFISKENAAKIISQLPPFVSSVGLFVNQTEENICDVINGVELDLLQFHGDEKEEFCNKFSKKYIKAIRVKSKNDILLGIEEFKTSSAILLDSYSSGSFGGTGKFFDWKMIPKDLSKPLIIAGGLKTDNLEQLFKLFSPYAVDVSSGVEKEKGKKSLKLMREFCSYFIK
jgi:phosphoribosylanthranilate isomerase